MLAVLMLLAIYVDSRRAAPFTVYLTIGAWVLYSCVLVVWLYYREGSPPIRALHLFDILVDHPDHLADPGTFLHAVHLQPGGRRLPLGFSGDDGHGCD